MYSASAGISLDGKPITVDNPDYHLCFEAANAAQLKKYMAAMFKLLVIAGFGFIKLSANGSMNVRCSCFDIYVFSAERIDFIADSTLKSDRLTQIRPPISYTPGNSIDCSEIPEVDESLYQATVEALKSAPEIIERSKKLTELRAMTIATERGISTEEAIKLVSSQVAGKLQGNDEVDFKKYGPVSVTDIIADPEKYDGEQCRDIAEPDQGYSKAKFYWNDGGRPLVHSMLHGGIKYYMDSGVEYSKRIFGNSPVALPECVLSEPPVSKNTDLMTTMVNRFVYMRDGNQVIDESMPPQHALMKKEEFINTFKPLGTIKSEGRGKPSLAVNMFLSDPRRRTVIGERYHPGESMIHTADGVDWFNPYNKPQWQQTSGRDLINPIIEQLRYLFPDENQFWRFMCWLAWTIVKPEIRIKHTPLLISKHHGTGRGWITELINKLLGGWNTATTEIETLSGKGNGGQYHNYLWKTLFCSIAEVKVDAKNAYAVDDAIRDKLTAEFLTLNLKYGPNGTYPIFTNFLMASNHRNALVLTKDDRRIDVYEHFGEKRPEEAYNILYGLLEDDDVMAQFYWFLHEWCAANKERYNPNAPAPLSPAKLRMIGGGENDATIAFHRCLDSSRSDVLTQGAIKQLWQVEYLRITGDTNGLPILTHCKQIEALTRKNLTQCNNGQKLKISQDAGSHKLYAIRNDNHWANADRSDLRAEFSKYRFP